MLEWQNEFPISLIQESGEGLYPPPQRACLVRGKHQWRRNGEQYECASGDQAHAERAQQLWISANEQGAIQMLLPPGAG